MPLVLTPPGKFRPALARLRPKCGAASRPTLARNRPRLRVFVCLRARVFLCVRVFACTLLRVFLCSCLGLRVKLTWTRSPRICSKLGARGPGSGEHPSGADACDEAGRKGLGALPPSSWNHAESAALVQHRSLERASCHEVPSEPLQAFGPFQGDDCLRVLELDPRGPTQGRSVRECRGRGVGAAHAAVGERRDAATGAS